MWKYLAMTSVLGGCIVEPLDSTNRDELGGTNGPVIYASDYLLKLDGVEGESKPDQHGAVFQWRPTDATTAQVAVITDCIGSRCHLTDVAAELQSSESTADGPTAVWRLAGAPDPSLGHVVLKGTPGDLTQTLKVSSGSWETVAPATSVHCVHPPDCVEIKGTFCVPICTLAP